MDLRDTPREAAFRAEARAFLLDHAPRGPLDFTDDAVVLGPGRAWQRTLHDHGWAALTWPVAQGGRGLSSVEQIIWNQELGRAGVRGGPFMVGVAMAGPTIIAHGSDAQRARYLGPMLGGDEIWCQLFSEPGAGSDLSSLRTRAVRDGDEWVVTGQKVWSSFAHLADFGILLARSGSGSDMGAERHKGMSYFLLDMRLPGIEVRPLRQMTGHAHFSEVFLEGVRVPGAALVGGEGQGWAVAMTTLLNERAAIGGIDPRASFEQLLGHARAHPEQADALWRDDLMRLYTAVRALELLNIRMLTRLGRGEVPLMEASLAKLAIARVRTMEADLGLRLLGPQALLREGPWQDRLLWAPSLHIAGGSDEIQKNIIAERVLGLPKGA